MLSRMQASIGSLTQEYTAKLKVSDANPETRELIKPAYVAGDATEGGDGDQGADEAEP
jgi:hypothetical protein